MDIPGVILSRMKCLSDTCITQAIFNVFVSQALQLTPPLKNKPDINALAEANGTPNVEMLTAIVELWKQEHVDLEHWPSEAFEHLLDYFWGFPHLLSHASAWRDRPFSLAETWFQLRYSTGAYQI